MPPTEMSSCSMAPAASSGDKSGRGSRRGRVVHRSDVVYRQAVGSFRGAILERHRRVQESRKAEMRAEAFRLASKAAEQFAFKRLYLFGSAVEARPVSVWSDIDLAVEGLPGDRFLELAGALSAGTSWPVDLKPYEELPASLRQRIALRGMVLHDRG